MSRRIACYMGDHTVLTTTKYGQKIYLDSRDISITPHIVLEGDWEPWVTRFFLNLLQQVSRHRAILDVGANVGWYSLLGAKSGFVVHAWEPNPRLYDLLQMTRSVNGFRSSMTISCAALGDVSVSRSSHEAYLSWDETDAGGGRVSAVNDIAARDDDRIADPVGIERLDEVVSDIEDFPPIGIIKIDVEGYEPKVLGGAEQTLEKNPEAHLLIEHNHGDGEMIGDLTERGYHFYWINHDSVPVPVEATKTGLVAMMGESAPGVPQLVDVGYAEMLWAHK